MFPKMCSLRQQEPNVSSLCWGGFLFTRSLHFRAEAAAGQSPARDPPNPVGSRRSGCKVRTSVLRSLSRNAAHSWLLPSFSSVFFFFFWFFSLSLSLAADGSCEAVAAALELSGVICAPQSLGFNKRRGRCYPLLTPRSEECEGTEPPARGRGGAGDKERSPEPRPRCLPRAGSETGLKNC